MVRKALIAAMAAVALAAGFGPRIDRSYAALQTGDDEPVAAALVELELGEPAAFVNAELVVEDVSLAPAFDADDFTDVRLSVVMHNVGPEAIPYSANAFLVDPTFPRLVLRDAVDNLHDIDIAHLARTVIPGSDVAVIEPGLAARWTLGFRVPTSTVNRLSLEALAGDLPLAAWDLAGQPSVLPAEPPPEDVASFEQPVAWADGVTIEARQLGELYCGDPSIEPIVHIMTVTFDVTNSSGDIVEWPGVLEPGTPGVAQWADGSAAEVAFETFVGDEETLDRASGRGSFIPPGTTQERALIFAAPRDGRFVDLDERATGVLMTPPTGGRIWLSLDGVEPSIGINPEMCYLGVTAGPSPYSFTPPAAYTPFPIGGVELTEARDAAAARLLDITIAGASLYFDANAKTFRTMTAQALGAFTPGIAVVSYDVATELTGAKGVVYFDVDQDRPDFLFVITQSESGTWLCRGVLARQFVTGGADATSTAAAEACWPEAFADEEAATQ